MNDEEIKFTNYELKSISKNLTRLINTQLKPIQKEIQDFNKRLHYVNALLCAIIDIQENLIDKEEE
ncbi:MAG: hypothetical protein J6W64_04650 [Bacilli bacterium]|nr:hypothetical protein [Bacilli bacterium]